MSFDIVFDAQHPWALAHFWAAALPGYAVRPYDDHEIERLAASGLTPETDSTVPIERQGSPTIWFQQSNDVTRVRNRIHLDLKQGVRANAQQRLTELGARVRETRGDHTVMLDPEGNQFCLFDA